MLCVRALLEAALLLASVQWSWGQQDNVCNVMDFGAVGDNATEDTAAVAAALAACDTVLLPKGYVFYLRPIELSSNQHLIIDGDVAAWRDIWTWPNSTNKVCATTPYETPLNETVTEPQIESLFWSIAATNLRVSGEGTVDGQGWRWWPLRYNGTNDYWHNCRPKLLCLGDDSNPRTFASAMRNLSVSGITLNDSPFWTISGRGLELATFSGVKVTTSGCGYSGAPNTDGFNVQGTSIVIENCAVHNGDDCVAIFPPTAGLTVRNHSCTCGNGIAIPIWPALNYAGGGGQVTGVTVDGVSFIGTANAVSIKSLPAFVGSAFDISFSNLQLHRVTTAININFLAQDRRLASAPPSALGVGAVVGAHASRISIVNVSGTVRDPGHFTCTEEEPCTGIQMENVVFDLTPETNSDVLDQELFGYDCAHASGLQVNCSPVPCDWPSI